MLSRRIASELLDLFSRGVSVDGVMVGVRFSAIRKHPTFAKWLSQRDGDPPAWSARRADDGSPLVRASKFSWRNGNRALLTGHELLEYLAASSSSHPLSASDVEFAFLEDREHVMNRYVLRAASRVPLLLALSPSLSL